MNEWMNERNVNHGIVNGLWSVLFLLTFILLWDFIFAFPNIIHDWWLLWSVATITVAVAPLLCGRWTFVDEWKQFPQLYVIRFLMGLNDPNPWINFHWKLIIQSEESLEEEKKTQQQKFQEKKYFCLQKKV